jgi:hypothetical protein
MGADESGGYLTSVDGDQSLHLPLVDTRISCLVDAGVAGISRLAVGECWVESTFSVLGPEGLERCVEVTVIALG